MVLESLTSPRRVDSKPWDLFFLGAIYAAMGVFLSLWVFEEQATIVMVLLTVIACVPLMYNTIRYEEKKDLNLEPHKSFLKEHSRILIAFMFLFLGFVLAFSMAYLLLPADVTQGLFSSQTHTINEINAGATGNDIVSGEAYSEGLLLKIFSNNLKVMLFCVFFSFFYGAGAIFILTWNATVISAAMGNFVRSHIGSYASDIGMASMGSYFQVYALSIWRYFIHGVPEIMAYIIGGLAGGLISVAVINHDFATKSFGKVMKDSLNLILLGVIVLFIAGIIEVYVTPAVAVF